MLLAQTLSIGFQVWVMVVCGSECAARPGNEAILQEQLN